MNKQDKTKLKKIVIAIAGKELELTPAQAKELRDILMELYGESVVKHEHHYDYWRPYIPYTWMTSSAGDRILCTDTTMTTTDGNMNVSSNVARLELVA